MSNASMRLVEVDVAMDDVANRNPKQSLDEAEDIQIHMVPAGERFIHAIKVRTGREPSSITACIVTARQEC